MIYYYIVFIIGTLDIRLYKGEWRPSTWIRWIEASATRQLWVIGNSWDSAISQMANKGIYVSFSWSYCMEEKVIVYSIESDNVAEH